MPQKPTNSHFLQEQYICTKQLEKTIEAAFSSFSSKQATFNTQLHNITQKALQLLKQKQTQVQLQLTATQEALTQRLDKKWSQFKNYAMLLRREYLAEYSNKPLPNFDLQSAKIILVELLLTETKQYELLKNYQTFVQTIKTWNLSTIQQQIKLRQPQQIKHNQVEEMQISPIKLKQDNYKIQERIYYNRRKDDEQEINIQPQSQLLKITHQQQKETGGIIKKYKTEVFKSQVNKSLKIESLYASKSQTNRLKLLRSSHRLATTRTQRHNFLSPTDNHKGKSERRFFWEKFQVLTNKKQDKLTKKGYRGCLQKLQKQQKLYQKVKNRFQ